MNGVAEIGDISKHLFPSTRPNYDNMTVEQLRSLYEEFGECTSLFKVTDNASEIFASQTTWTYYSNMNRIFKHY